MELPRSSLRCVILQPSYIPWRGYFDLIDQADLFIFYDDVQYDKRGWRNRNRIKTPHGPRWLTIPVHSKGAQTDHILINKIRIDWSKPWSAEHWQTLKFAYSKAPYFKEYSPLLEECFNRRDDYLADFTIELTISLSRLLGITKTRFLRSSGFGVSGAKTDRLINLLLLVGATDYLSGPSARDYIEVEKFQKAGINLDYAVYDYPEYEQLHPPYDPQVSILDLMFMKGPETLRFFRKDAQ